MNFTMTKIAAALVLTVAATGAQAVSQAVVAPSNFTMTVNGGLDQSYSAAAASGVGLDTALAGFVDKAAGTWGVSSTNTFFGGLWTASGGSLITTAGNYALNTATGAVALATPDLVGTSDGLMRFTVGAGQAAGTINFAWGATSGIRVVDVWNVTTDGSGNWTSLATAKVPGMENGPFLNYNAGFNMTLAPVPEASTYGMMLAGLGLVGFAVRRRKLMA